MNTKHLRTFLAVVDAGSFTRAARSLACSQPTVTSRIKSLEQDLGDALFQRSTGAVELTIAGSALIPYAKRMVRLEQNAREAVRGAIRNNRPLVVGVSESVTRPRLVPIVEYMYFRYPDADLMLRNARRADILGAVGDADVDCAFITDFPHRSDALDTQVLAQERLELVASPGHELAGTGQLRLADLRATTLIRLEPGSDYGSHFEQLVLQQVGAAPRVLDIDSIDVVRQAVGSGIGVALLPESAVAGDLSAGRLARLRWTVPFTVCTQLVWRREDADDPAVSRIAAAVAKASREELELPAGQA